MSVTTIPLLEDLQGPWGALQIQLVGPAAPAEPIVVPDIYPFTSVTDLKRQLWIHMRGDPRWAPERVFLAAGGRPIEFHWSKDVMGGEGIVDLADPVAHRNVSTGLIDETGNRRPVGPTMIGSLILETALSPEIVATGALPTLRAICLAALVDETVTVDTLTPQLFGGYYQLYFPWLTAPAQVLDAGSTAMTPMMREAYAAAVPYIEDRVGRVSVAQRAVQRRVGGASVTMQTMVRLRWVMPQPMHRPESLEKTFYGLRASTRLPFLRYFPAGGGTPLLKLGLEENGTPIVSDPRIFAQYINQTAPAPAAGAVILARVPMVSAHAERGAAFTLYMFEDGTSDITLEVPQRGATYIAAVAVDAERILRDVLVAIGFAASVRPVLRDLHATYRWAHPEPRRSAPLSTARLQSRVAALTPFFDVAPRLPDDTALITFQWRAVSNYESETAQFAFITQLVLRDGMREEEEGIDALRRYVGEIQGRFGVTEDAAMATLEAWMSRRGRAVAPAPGPAAGALAVARHSTGASVAISGTHPEYLLEIQGVDSADELHRIVTLVGVLMGASSGDLAIAAPAAVVEEQAALVAVVDAAAAAAAVAEGAPPASEEAELAEFEDPAMAALMAELGLGGGEELGPEGEGDEEGAAAAAVTAVAPPELIVENVGAGAAAAAPAAEALDAALAAVESECQANPWKAGEPALKLKADWYMARLKKEDTVLFGYPADKAGRVKTYSKSCQRRDDRQPNIMTVAEYARVKRCYEDRVRFVDLPPRRPEDLPTDPAFHPKNKRFSVRDNPDYYMADPADGRPMWSVYGYENKSRPGEFLFLMCSELWCDRDNLPLLRSEYEGVAGRGFSKPPNTCPFCGGGLIADMSAPRPGESVIVRAPKETTGKIHSFIGTITRNKHPRGYPLPCCDTTPRLLKKYMDAAFYGTIVYGRDLAAVDEDEDEEGGGAGAAAAAAAGNEDAEPEPDLELDVEPPPAGPGAPTGLTDYRRILDSMQTQYILSSDKSLDAGKIGLLPPLLDAFFGQSSTQSIVTRGIRPTFKDGAHIFVHVGVDTQLRTPGHNLYAGLAPLLGLESAEQVKREFLQKRIVRAFESANYGTMVQEFAARSRLTDAQVSAKLGEFASEFGYKEASRPHVVRLYKAWVAFLEYLNSSARPKQLRHLEHLLAQPNVLTPRGLLLVVLEQNEGRIEVACPSFGIPTASLFGDVPIAFMWHDRRDDSWEPIVLYNNTRSAVRFFGEAMPELAALPRALQTSLRRWLREWRDSSRGCGRPAPPPHVWTPDRDTRDLPRLSQLLQVRREFSTTALVRDRSNRLAGVLIAAATLAGGDATPLFVPCLDDGNLAQLVPRIHEADMIPAAPLDSYLRLYTALAAAEFAGLRPTQLLTRMTSDPVQVIGFEVAAGARIPVTPVAAVAAAPRAAELGVREQQQVDMFPWERDALILRAPDAPGTAAVALEESTVSIEEQLAEAYQHLRLSFSTWLGRDARGARVKQDLAALVKGGLPLYEKRKRMDIMLEPLIREMIRVEETTERRALSLLRVDCLAVPQAECAGACSWGGDRGCMIHAPVRSAATDPVRVFTARLSDEILRYARQRNEIMTASVPEIRIPRGAVRVGSELYIATRPKETAAGIMERLGFTGVAPTAFPEEMLRFEGLEEEAAVVAADESMLPMSWREKGLTMAAPPADVEDANRLAFAAATERSIEEWETAIQGRRAAMGLPGRADRPFQWSTQDMYVIATIARSDVVFVRLNPATGAPVVERMVRPAAGVQSLGTIVLWGARELVVTKGKQYRLATRDMPADLLAALDGASPIPEVEARGHLDLAAEPAQPPEGTAAAGEESSSSPAPAPALEEAEAP